MKKILCTALAGLLLCGCNNAPSAANDELKEVAATNNNAEPAAAKSTSTDIEDEYVEVVTTKGDTVLIKVFIYGQGDHIKYKNPK